MNFEARLLSAPEHHLLLPLLAAYGAEMAPHLAGAAPATPAAMMDLISNDPRAEILLAFGNDAPLGFALFFDLPEIVFARRCGALDDLFVAPGARRQGVAQALIEALAALGAARGWSHLRWMVPETDQAAIALYERIAARAPWRSYVLRLDPRASL
ncbi:MAG: GNAT family N-acetyltransferase [Roseomonas sp.]|nr:GNAT family N-acetyltransferase [Roseomonas sp.]MCA3328277.1 GNAT family N-acetyltransferase [Roseomonas sp.]MCA3329850.1 GNAT family N-acetyltransferase [Roseomonas sp.]MCA3333513.1 GNAT family N-acetyltransferase [Roseomonas sp.]MCA3346005.1 GNAT family N-acetyltransferase [Roseomonas sp.]